MYLPDQSAESIKCGCGCESDSSSIDLINDNLVTDGLSLPFQISIPYNSYGLKSNSIASLGTSEVGGGEGISIISFDSVENLLIGVKTESGIAFSLTSSILFDNPVVDSHSKSIITTNLDVESSRVITFGNIDNESYNGDPISWSSTFTWNDLISLQASNDIESSFFEFNIDEIYISPLGDYSSKVKLVNEFISIVGDVSGNISGAFSFVISSVEFPNLYVKNSVSTSTGPVYYGNYSDIWVTNKVISYTKMIPNIHKSLFINCGSKIINYKLIEII